MYCVGSLSWCSADGGPTDRRHGNVACDRGSGSDSKHSDRRICRFISVKSLVMGLLKNGGAKIK